MFATTTTGDTSAQIHNFKPPDPYDLRRAIETEERIAALPYCDVCIPVTYRHVHRPRGTVTTFYKSAELLVCTK